MLDFNRNQMLINQGAEENLLEVESSVTQVRFYLYLSVYQRKSMDRDFNHKISLRRKNE
jgi:hypothetical protein